MRLILLPILASAMIGTASADEPMTVEEVVAAARADLTFVSNDYIISRQSENPDVLIFDVRTKAEFDLGHIPGAEWMPRGRAEFSIARTVRDADAEMIIYCRSGSRAALVKKALDAQGYRNVSVHEGFTSWAEAGQPFENGVGLLQLVQE